MIVDSRNHPVPSEGTPERMLWSLKDVAWALNIGRRTLERQVAAGRFPKADCLIGTMPRWKPETVRAWVDRRS